MNIIHLIRQLMKGYHTDEYHQVCTDYPKYYSAHETPSLRLNKIRPYSRLTGIPRLRVPFRISPDKVPIVIPHVATLHHPPPMTTTTVVAVVQLRFRSFSVRTRIDRVGRCIPIPYNIVTEMKPSLPARAGAACCKLLWSRQMSYLFSSLHRAS